jgi:tetratricopeptide (TPR) repeat protein
LGFDPPHGGPTGGCSLAEFWRADGDLDEAAQHAERALRLLSGLPTAPNLLAVTATLTAAEIARDRTEYPAAHAGFVSAVDALSASDPHDRLLVRALIGLGDSHRRAARYPEAVQTLSRPVELAEAAVIPAAALLAAALMVLGITSKEMGDFGSPSSATT